MYVKKICSVITFNKINLKKHFYTFRDFDIVWQKSCTYLFHIMYCLCWIPFLLAIASWLFCFLFLDTGLLFSLKNSNLHQNILLESDDGEDVLEWRMFTCTASWREWESECHSVIHYACFVKFGLWCYLRTFDVDIFTPFPPLGTGLRSRDILLFRY